MTKKYECNDELAKVLIEQYNFLELKSEKNPMKRYFKPSIQSKFKIYFDYINFHVLYGDTYIFSSIGILESELKKLQWYLKQNSIFRNKVEYSELNTYFKNLKKDVEGAEEVFSELKIKASPEYILKRKEIDTFYTSDLIKV